MNNREQVARLSDGVLGNVIRTLLARQFSGIAVALCITSLSFAAPAAADNSVCADCHADVTMFEDYGARAASLTITDEVLAHSVHEGLDCTDCHADLADVDEFPHADTLMQADCSSCHDSEAEVYQWHGRLEVGSDQDIPHCASCHGSHNIRPSDDRASMVNPINLPATCGTCHEDIDLVEKHHIRFEHPVTIFESSVHGKASLGGIYTAATCNDCHSSNGTAHMILSPGDSRSSINHFNIPRTCGRCHHNTEQDYWDGIHGELTLRGETDSPVCTDCHGEHGILNTDDPRSPVSPARLAEATCSPCHESARLNDKYGVTTGRLQTWVDSYHGLKSKAGDVTVANCSSCHGAHRILPSTDSTSSIHANNLQSTCGHCHPGISVAFANAPIHGQPGVTGTAAARWVEKIYIVAIFVIIGAMVVHWLIDLRKQIKIANMQPQLRRMQLNEVWQHAFLMTTFIALVITGFALRFSEAWWVKLLFGWEGGFPVRGIVHRTSAVLFMFTCIWHMIFLTRKRGRQFLLDMRPEKNDFTQFVQMISYNLGIRKERPQLGRFGYVEKAEYWALVWGSAVMIVSGFFMWYENVAVQLFPKGFLDVMLVVHYYEAWLATLAILIWHMYSTVFNPAVYPMNPSWFTGKMPYHAYRHEHPADPIFTEEPPPVELPPVKRKKDLSL